MQSLQPYLHFDGNCREAMDFYHDALGGELTLSTFAEAPEHQPGDPGRVLHAQLTAGNVTVMASDIRPGESVRTGTHLHLSLRCDDLTEYDYLWSKLTAGGRVQIAPLNSTWGDRWGMFQDRFGVGWMLTAPL